MNDTHDKNLAIGVLSITAMVLLVGLVIVSRQPSAFAAAGPGIQTGDYILTTGQFLPDEDLLYVVDAVQERLVVYRFDVRSRQSFAPVDSHDLAAMRTQGTPPPATGDKNPPKRGGNRP